MVLLKWLRSGASSQVSMIIDYHDKLNKSAVCQGDRIYIVFWEISYGSVSIGGGPFPTFWLCGRFSRNGHRILGICPWKMSILNFGFDFPIVRSKIKIDVHRRVTYQNLSGEQNVQKPSENTTFPKYGNFGCFLDVFSLLVTRIDLILFSVGFLLFSW